MKDDMFLMEEQVKTVLFVSALFFAGLTTLTAAEDDWETFPYNLGGGLEMNMNTKEGWAQGFTAVVDRHITRHLTLGIRGTLTNDYRNISAAEGGLFARLYVWKPNAGGAFTQIGGGFGSFQEEDRRRIAFVLSYGAGYRFYFLKGFYAETYVQAGYPFRWGIGLTAGHWFNF
jgi:hypothetical protein